MIPIGGRRPESRSAQLAADLVDDDRSLQEHAPFREQQSVVRVAVDAYLESVFPQSVQQRTWDFVVEGHEVKRGAKTLLALQLRDVQGPINTRCGLNIMREHGGPRVLVRPEPDERQLPTIRRDENQS